MSRAVRRRDDESANGLIIIISMMPLILSAFGLGLDMAKNVWIKTSLQGRLDGATVAAAGVTRVSANGQSVVIDARPTTPDNAYQTARRFYALNRPGFVLCRSSPPVIANSGGLRMCWTEVAGTPALSADSKTIRYSIRETSPNSGFLTFVNLDFQKYRLESKARIKE